MKTFSIRKWKAARFFPETYPGECPDSSFLFYGDRVSLLYHDSKLGFKTINATKEFINIDELLSYNKLPLLNDRFPVIAYGANRNPATIEIKLENYNYETPGRKTAIPMLKGSLHNADVIASGIHGQGYFYGDLLLDSEFTKNCSIEVWISLLDKDQLRVMNDSEDIHNKLYSLAWIDSVYLADTKQKIRALTYVSNSPMLVIDNKPIAFNQIKAVNRRIPSLNSLEILDRFLQTFELEESVSKITGISIHPNFSFELMKYLNKQWWYKFNTKNEPSKGFQKIIDLFQNVIEANSISGNSADHLKTINQIIPPEEAYHLGYEFSFKKMI